MWLRKTGRHKNLKLERQFHPNPDYCTLRVTGQITRGMILTLTSSEKNTRMINNLCRIKGITHVEPVPYYVMIKKKNSVDWQEILPEAEKIIIQHLVKE